MKTKIPILIAAGLFLSIVSKAQYGSPCPDNRVVIQGRVLIPGPPVIAFQYSNVAPIRYDERRDSRYDDYGRYDDRRDWRAVEYENYCREHRGYRMSREEFYRERCDYRGKPHFKKKKLVVYGY
jgi:hypothetical protein